MLLRLTDSHVKLGKSKIGDMSDISLFQDLAISNWQNPQATIYPRCRCLQGSDDSASKTRERRYVRYVVID